MERFCPKCGKKITQDEMINNFCVECYISEKQLIKIPDIEITICVKCNKIKYGNKWYAEFSEIEEAILKNIKIISDLNQPKLSTKLNIDLEKNINFLEVSILTIIGNKLKELKYTKEVVLKKDTCLSCSRVAGNYYTTILQVRFNNKEIQKQIFEKIYKEVYDIINVINKRTNKPSANINIVKETFLKNGFDIYTDNLKYTNNLSTHLLKHKSALERKFSKSLVGVDKNGKKLYRTTICVHFGYK